MHKNIKSTQSEFYYLNAFSQNLGSGNPTIVIKSENKLPRSIKQQLAKEFNLSETVFLDSFDGERAAISWFTPSCEVELCGHGTLSAAFVILNQQANDKTPPLRSVQFYSDKYKLSCIKNQNGAITLQFPLVSTKNINPSNEIYRVLGQKATLINLAQNKPSQGYLVAEIEDTPLENVFIDTQTLKETTTNSLILTCLSTDENNEIFVQLRYFAPSHGVDEDIVTGSANVVLADYYYRNYGLKAFRSVQKSHRGGGMHVEHKGNHIQIQGHCFEIARGQLSSQI